MMNWQPDTRQLVLLKVALLLLGMLPFAYLLTGAPDPDPVAFAQRWTGTWTINFLLLCPLFFSSVSLKCANL